MKARLACACGEIASRLVERGLERALVDGEQQVALLDHLAVGEMDGVEISRHPGTNLDGVDRDEPPDILVLIDDAALRSERATVTFGGGGAACCCGASLQAASATGITPAGARARG